MSVKALLSAATLAAAAIAIPAPAQAALGSTAAVCVPGTPNCATPVGKAVGSAVAGPSIFKNNFIWMGTQNPAYWNSEDTVEVWTFTPLNAVLWAKPFMPGLWTWFESQERQTCVIGITTALGGPYSAAGTYTHSYNHGGCSPS